MTPFFISYNQDKEIVETKSFSYRDFYEVRKVDNHLHQSAAMSAKMLVDFIGEKYKTDADKEVYFDKQKNEHLTLYQIFQECNVSPTSINVDALDMQVNYCLKL